MRQITHKTTIFVCVVIMNHKDIIYVCVVGIPFNMVVCPAIFWSACHVLVTYYSLVSARFSREIL